MGRELLMHKSGSASSQIQMTTMLNTLDIIIAQLTESVIARMISSHFLVYEVKLILFARVKPRSSFEYSRTSMNTQ